MGREWPTVREERDGPPVGGLGAADKYLPGRPVALPRGAYRPLEIDRLKIGPIDYGRMVLRTTDAGCVFIMSNVGI